MDSIRRRQIGGWSSWLRRLRPSRHLTERELTALTVDLDAGTDPVMATAAAHLAECPDCAAREVETRLFLEGLADGAESAFDAATPLHRLATQRHRILRRIERATDPGPARILRFPIITRPTIHRASSVHRWFAAAAMTGLLVGMALVQPGSVSRPEPAGAPAGGETPTAAAATAPAPETLAAQADEQFMRELEAALDTRHVAPLVTLDEMTPRLRDASTDIR